MLTLIIEPKVIWQPYHITVKVSQDTSVVNQAKLISVYDMYDMKVLQKTIVKQGFLLDRYGFAFLHICHNCWTDIEIEEEE